VLGFAFLDTFCPCLVESLCKSKPCPQDTAPHQDSKQLSRRKARTEWLLWSACRTGEVRSRCQTTLGESIF
jgi:hypothetical protein